jgi:photosystem II stability/assembly factor-like uncharacterized protein
MAGPILLLLAIVFLLACEWKQGPDSSAGSRFGDLVPLLAPNEGPLMGITYGAGRFCVVGAHGLIFDSDDGKRWRQVRNPIREDLRQVFYHPGWDDTGGRFGSFVAVGKSGALYGDQGKAEWKVLARPWAGRFLRLYHPTGDWSGTLLDSGVLLASYPGREEDPESWFRTYARSNATLEAACSGNALFVAVGPRGTIVSIADSEFARANYAFSLRESPTRADLHGVAWAGDRFVAVGDSGIILSSADGEHWGKETSALSGTVRGVASGMGMCIALAENGVAARKAFPAADPDTIPADAPLALGLWLSPDSLAFQVGRMGAKRDTGLVSPRVSPRADNWDPKLPGLPTWGDGLKDFVPYGWDLFGLDSGDLNHDHLQDYAFIVEGKEAVSPDPMPGSEPSASGAGRILAIVFGSGTGKGYRLLQQCDTCIDVRYDERLGQDVHEGGGPHIVNDTLILQSHWKSLGGWEENFEEYSFKYMDGAIRMVAGERKCVQTNTGEYEKRNLDRITGLMRTEKGAEMTDTAAAPTMTTDTLPVPEIGGFERMNEAW